MFRIFIFLAAACAAQLHAQEPPPLTVDRDSAVQRALYGNRGLLAARYSIQRASARTIDAGAWSNPSLNLSGASDFAFSNEGEYTWSVGLEQRFPVTDRLRRLRNIASLEVQLAELEIRDAERLLAYEVEQIFDRVAFIDTELTLYQEQIDLNQKFAAFLQKKIDRAEASTLDRGQIKVSMAALKQKVFQLERQRFGQLVHLRELLGLELDQGIEIQPDAADAQPHTLPEFRQAQLDGHPAYQLRQQLADIANEHTALAQAERWQDIAVEVFYENGLANNAIQDPLTNNVYVGAEREQFIGIGLSIPLPLHSQNRGEVISRRARERQLQAEAGALGFRLQNEAAEMREEYAEVDEQIADYDTAVMNQATDNLRQLEDAYAIGQIDLTTVFRAQERLLELRLDRALLETERQDLLTQWRYITASNVTAMAVEEEVGDE
ncbi:TolC family protein [Cerasicoccus maritimus]|uniref:TolC family protein n=1 Tax=Cerasicoccus maritimus TaxID=490089 RepID=UPI002852A2B2|nr:TolC family protein [Cerasicoccus maritimus]